MTLRQLRIWHWMTVLERRKLEFASKGVTKVKHNRIANFHLSAVQALNDVPELIGTTAEHDAAEDGIRNIDDALRKMRNSKG